MYTSPVCIYDNNCSYLQERTGISAAMLRKRIGLPEAPHLKPKPKELEGVTAKEEVEELPDDIFTKPIQLTESKKQDCICTYLSIYIAVTTIEQRLLQPDAQPATVDKLFPIHKQLSVKQSLRCRKCEHNVSKPEYNPNSVKFKIQLFA